jgi:hypothetical protein
MPIALASASAELRSGEWIAYLRKMTSQTNGSGWILVKVLQQINLLILQSGLPARRLIHGIPNLTNRASSRSHPVQTVSNPLPRQPLHLLQTV